MIRERGLRGVVRRWRSKEPFLAATVFLLAAVITVFLTLFVQPPTARFSSKAKHDSEKIEEPASIVCVGNSASQIEVITNFLRSLKPCLWVCGCARAKAVHYET